MKFLRMDTPFFFTEAFIFFAQKKKISGVYVYGEEGIVEKGGGEIEDLPKLDKIHLYKSMKFVLNAYSFE